MISLRNLTLQRGTEPLLQGTDLTIHDGERLGVVGPNGCGKSTLFELLRGRLQPEAGELAMPPGLRVVHVAQQSPSSQRSAVDYVLDGHDRYRALQARIDEAHAADDGHALAAAHEAMDDIGGYALPARAAELLNGLGFPEPDQRRVVNEFSGGWRVRISLARALINPGDLLLLDEPTNHLDLEAVFWLEQYLRSVTATQLVISHDRDFLDSVAQGIVHFEARRLRRYNGGYSAFERQRAERLAQQQAFFEKQQRERARVERFIERFRAKAHKAALVQSRIKALERMEAAAPAHVDSPFRFEFEPPERLPNPLVALDGVSIGYDGKPVLTDVGLSLRPESRVGLLGPNGAGKSTLVKLLSGAIGPLGGEAHFDKGLAVGYFAQHQLEQLDDDASPLTHIQRLTPGALEQPVRDFLGGFDFSGDRALEAVHTFSGGERARLVLAMLVWQRPNLLLLDEPTNHLDLEMRHALTLALQSFEGALVVVAHDRHLLENVVDEYLLVADGTVRTLPGGLKAYQQFLQQRRSEARQAAAADKPAGGRKDDRRERARQRQALQPLKRRVTELERELEGLETELSEIEEAMADPALYEPDAQERLQALTRRRGELRRAQADLEGQWAEAQEALDAAAAGES